MVIIVESFAFSLLFFNLSVLRLSEDILCQRDLEPCSGRTGGRLAEGRGRPGGTATASASDTGLAGALAAQRARLVSSGICQPGGGQSHSSESSAFPLSSLTPSSLGREMGSLEVGLGMPGPQQLPET